ncbi:DUF1205 domain-containing protein [Dactylosporangium sp. AC04546]|uniref:nucleotide disphospho-sugar-binding domain-containing protein n=1 Tax=Dactylosporangium sp. AC04546 TaxID=2862460 RepID=UPI002E7BFABC|nr:nucleotide disphospho-sugar-binding domain-containing protein [Dactylosporangium sp. AC04546]WVK79087.1 DUF1205 domain-containing protein [Dactylosporangium sp. AC04546]
MRVLFTVSSWATHYATMVPLGWALQAAGHEVRVVCPPSQVPSLSATGLVPVPVLDGLDVRQRLRLQYYDQAVAGAWPYPWLPPHPLTGAPLRTLAGFDRAAYAATQAPLLAARAAAGHDAALAYARWWRPDLVLHDPASLEGALVGAVLGVASVMCLWGPVGTHEPGHAAIVPPDHSGSFPRHGLGEFTPDRIHTVIDPCPAAVAPPLRAARLRVRYVPYNGAAPSPPWLPDPPPRPRVAVSWSTALTTTSGPRSYLLPTLVAALHAEDVDLVVTATREDVAALGTVPPGVRVAEHVPLRLLLPTCAAVIHHGGGGSTLTSLWAGVPQLVATFAAEQSASAARVAAAGAGLHVEGHEATEETIRTSVKALLSDPSFAAAARAQQADMAAQPTPADLVATLSALTR